MCSILVLGTDIGQNRAKGLDLDERGWLTMSVTVEEGYAANGLTFAPDETIAGLLNATYTAGQLR